MTIYTLAVVGHPVTYSLSPKMHRFWLQQCGLQGDYVAIATNGTQQGFREVVSSAFQQGFHGLNVTVPHKQHAFAFANIHSQEALLTGAVNTLSIDRSGQIYGNNTDISGFINNLKDHPAYPSALATKAALILGAGGAMRSVLLGLLQQGFDNIAIANRTLNKAQEVVNIFQPQYPYVHFTVISLDNWTLFVGKMPKNSLLVNTTSLGMQGQPSLAIVKEWPENMLVTDIVYQPLITPLLEQTRSVGLPIQDGLGMLLYQGASAFAHWTGHKPPVNDSLRHMILSEVTCK